MLPFTNRDLATGYGYQGSGVYPIVEGSGDRWFFITKGSNIVDQVKIEMQSVDNQEVLFEALIDVDHEFGD